MNECGKPSGAESGPWLTDTKKKGLLIYNYKELNFANIWNEFRRFFPGPSNKTPGQSSL